MISFCPNKLLYGFTVSTYYDIQKFMIDKTKMLHDRFECLVLLVIGMFPGPLLLTFLFDVVVGWAVV